MGKYPEADVSLVQDIGGDSNVMGDFNTEYKFRTGKRGIF